MGLFDVFSGDSAKEAAAAKAAALQTGYNQFSDLAGQGRGALTTNYTAALQPYQELYAKGSRGYDAYADATGASGPEGLARAKANFQASPGFEFALNQALDANDRRAAGRGMLASGNTIDDTNRIATGYAMQDWGNYVDRLQPFLGQASGAAAGQAGLYSGLGEGLNRSYLGQGAQAYNTQAGIGDANADAAMADYNASANLWNFGLNAAKTAAGFLGGGK